MSSLVKRESTSIFVSAEERADTNRRTGYPAPYVELTAIEVGPEDRKVLRLTPEAALKVARKLEKYAKFAGAKE